MYDRPTVPKPTSAPKAPAPSASAPQAVIVHLKLSDGESGSIDEREDAYALGEELEELLGAVGASGPGVGDYEGHTFGEGWCRITFSGPDARALADTLLPLLRDTELPEGSFLTMRFGPPGAPQEEVGL